MAASTYKSVYIVGGGVLGCRKQETHKTKVQKGEFHPTNLEINGEYSLKLDKGNGAIPGIILISAIFSYI